MGCGCRKKKGGKTPTQATKTKARPVAPFRGSVTRPSPTKGTKVTR